MMMQLPLMGLGTFIGIEEKRIDDPNERHDVTITTILTALRQGYRHFDLAVNYSNLSAVAKALHIAFQPIEAGGLGLTREDLWLTMKIEASGCHAGAIQRLLENLNIAYFDLVLIHFPSSIFQSREQLMSHWKSLSEVESVLHIGVSNFYEPHLQRLIEVCETEHLPKPYVNQIQMNIWVKEPTVVEFCKEHDIRVMAYSPLGYAFSSIILRDEILQRLASELNATPAQIVLAWLMKQDIAVIPKSTTPQRLAENFEAQSLVAQLTEAHMTMLDAIVAPEAYAEFVVLEVAADSKRNGDAIGWESPEPSATYKSKF